MKVNARNQLKGTVAEVHRGPNHGPCRINVGGTTRTASFTNAAAEELKLAKGMTVRSFRRATSWSGSISRSALSPA